MPTVEEKQTCKICGSPSITVVCMHCFLNYNYKIYACDDHPQPVAKSGLQPMNSAKIDEDEYWQPEPKHKKEDKDNAEAHPQFSLGSIFSRLPRFE